MSALEEFQAKREAEGQDQDSTVDILVPKSDRIYVRFAYVDLSEVQAIQKRIVGKRNPRPSDTLKMNTALLVEACRGVFSLEPDKGKISIDPDNPTEDPAQWLRFDPRLGDLLGVEKSAGAAAVALKLFGSPWAVQAVADEYDDFLRPTAERLEDEHRGE